MTTTLSRRAAVTRILAGTLVAGATAAAGPALADDTMDARHVLEESAITVDRVRQELKSSSDMDDLLARSKGVLIIPSYNKASFILGGAYGDGVLLQRMPDGSGFGDPAFYRMTAGSIGLQIGMKSDEVVFMILTEKGLSAVLNDEFKLGANVGMSIGTIGAGAEAATTTHVGQDIVAYSKSSGLFAGGSLEGAVIRPRKDWNAAVYGVGNDNPQAVIQRNQLRAAVTVKDALAKGIYPARPGVN
jgi:lipid-binding SYLF domain-containing protein